MRWRAPIASSNSQRPISHSTSFNPRLSSKWITKPRIVRILVFNRGCESHRSAFRGPSLVRPPGSGQPNFPDDCLHKYQTLHPGRLDGCRDKGLEHLSATFFEGHNTATVAIDVVLHKTVELFSRWPHEISLASAFGTTEILNSKRTHRVPFAVERARPDRGDRGGSTLTR